MRLNVIEYTRNRGSNKRDANLGVQLKKNNELRKCKETADIMIYYRNDVYYIKSCISGLKFSLFVCESL